MFPAVVGTGGVGVGGGVGGEPPINVKCVFKILTLGQIYKR